MHLLKVLLPLLLRQIRPTRHRVRLLHLLLLLVHAVGRHGRRGQLHYRLRCPWALRADGSRLHDGIGAAAAGAAGTAGEGGHAMLLRTAGWAHCIVAAAGVLRGHQLLLVLLHQVLVLLVLPLRREELHARRIRS